MGQRHLWYIRQYRKVFCTNLLTSGRLNSYLADIDRQAEELFFRLVKQMSERENVTEAFKVQDQMPWWQKMSNIRNRATKIVDSDLVYR